MQFEVSRVTASPDDPRSSGCPGVSAGYACHFTVVIDTRNATAGSRLSGTLTATARGAGGSQTRTAGFSADVPPGATTISTPVPPPVLRVG